MDLEVQDFQTTDVLVILGASMVLLEISGDDPLNLPFALFVKCFFCWSGGVTGKTWAHWFFRIGAFRSSFLAVFRLFTGKI